MEPFNVEQAFDKIRPMDKNAEIMIQVLESRIFGSILNKKEDYSTFKTEILEMPWEEREINIIQLAQQVYDLAVVPGRPDFVDYKRKIQSAIKGLYEGMFTGDEIEVNYNSFSIHNQTETFS